MLLYDARQSHPTGVVTFVVEMAQVNYFPSRFDPVRNAEKFPQNPAVLHGRREKAIIEKENNFQQPGERFRSWDPARQERFVARLSGALSHARCTQVCGPAFIKHFASDSPTIPGGVIPWAWLTSPLACSCCASMREPVLKRLCLCWC
jgi:catalase